MTKSELCAIIFKSFAVYHFYKAVWFFLSALLPIFLGQIGADQFFRFHLVINIFLYAVFGIALWLSAGKLGSFMAAENKEIPVSIFPPQDFMSAVFVGAGCIILSQAIPHLSEMGAIYFSEEPKRSILIKNYSALEKSIMIGLYFLVGFYLVMGAKGLQRMIFKIRNMGTEK
ncbi:MAG: hypothetical protein CMH28_01550 [Micavibrio sp.]|nr:hypothetical protein [Micavibrio sp.]